MYARNYCRGFTLVELLTVIGIIAVLSAILFPVFSSAREKSRQIACMNNMQQIGKALNLYIEDSGGFMPTWCLVHNNPGSAPSNPDNSGFLTWDAQLMAYLDTSQVFICPSNPNEGGGSARAYAIAHYTQVPVSGDVLDNTWQAMKGCYRDLMPAPTRTVFIYEKGANPPGAWGDCLGQNVWETHGHKSDGSPASSEEMFHNNGKNILYCDGHSKFSPGNSYPFNYNSGRTAPLAAIDGDVWFAAKQSEGGDWPPRK
ncbi:MAG: type II secretion system protein [Armatimonadota bacterium]